MSSKAGRKRLAVEHISLELLQQEGYFDMPIQVRIQDVSGIKECAAEPCSLQAVPR